MATNSKFECRFPTFRQASIAADCGPALEEGVPMKYLAGFCVFLFVLLTGASAQPDSAAAGNPEFTQTELDQMLAPIALYPDGLLSQVLMAATYPLEVVEAARWSQANPGLK